MCVPSYRGAANRYKNQSDNHYTETVLMMFNATVFLNIIFGIIT